MSIDQTDHLNLRCGRCGLALAITLDNVGEIPATDLNKTQIDIFAKCVNCKTGSFKWRKMYVQSSVKLRRKEAKKKTYK